MENFEKRKEEYFDKLRTNPELISGMLSKGEDEKSKKMLTLLLTPKNEEELEQAEAVYQFMCDLSSVIERIITGDIKEIPLEQNECLDLYATIINTIKSGNEDEDYIKGILQKKYDGVSVAKFLYDSLVSLLGNAEETVIYWSEKCGINLEDPIEAAQFQIYFERAREIFDNKTPDVSNVDVDDSEQLKQFIEFAKEFHTLSEEGKIERSEEEQRKKWLNFFE